MQREGGKMAPVVRDVDNDDTLDDESWSSENTSPRRVDSTDPPPQYPSNIAAACHAASTTQKVPKQSVAEDAIKLEKRRKSNRLSAQRWRMRKRSKFAVLQDQIQVLKKQHEELKLEQAELQAELRVQLALTQAEMAHMNSSLVAATTIGNVQRALCASRAKKDLLARLPPSRGGAQSLLLTPSVHALGLKALSSSPHPYHHWAQYNSSLCSSGPFATTSSFIYPTGVSHVPNSELRAMLRVATSTKFPSIFSRGVSPSFGVRMSCQEK